jgi:hypothetical protein
MWPACLPDMNWGNFYLSGILKDKLYNTYSKNLRTKENLREQEVRKDSKCIVFHFPSRALMWINSGYFWWCNRSGSWRIPVTELRSVHRHMSPQVTTTLHGQMAWLILLQSWLGISNVSKNGSHILPKITRWFVVQLRGLSQGIVLWCFWGNFAGCLIKQQHTFSVQML